MDYISEDVENKILDALNGINDSYIINGEELRIKVRCSFDNFRSYYPYCYILGKATLENDYKMMSEKLRANLCNTIYNNLNHTLKQYTEWKIPYEILDKYHIFDKYVDTKRFIDYYFDEKFRDFYYKHDAYWTTYGDFLNTCFLFEYPFEKILDYTYYLHLYLDYECEGDMQLFKQVEPDVFHRY